MALADVLRWVLGALLLFAAAAKLAAGREGRAAFGSYGVGSPAMRAGAWGMLIAVEAAIAVAVLAGSRRAAEAGAALLVLSGLALLAALAVGHAGAPCGCFGRRSRISRLGAARALVLAAGFAALSFVPDVRPSAQTWLAAGLVTALVGTGALAVAILALARELGEVRLALGPQAALSVAHEGPQLGSRVGLIERFEPPARLAVAVFSSPSCPLCRTLEPALRLVATDPDVALRVFDEVQDAAAWQSLRVPGSPYSVVLDVEGTVLAKGTFNTLPQLEGLLAAAERREREPVHA